MVEKVFLQETTYSLVCFFFISPYFIFPSSVLILPFFPHPSSFFALFPSEFYRESLKEI